MSQPSLPGGPAGPDGAPEGEARASSGVGTDASADADADAGASAAAEAGAAADADAGSGALADGGSGSGPGYAEALAELEAILAELDGPDLDVDVLGARVGRAAELIRLCRTRITDARIEVEQVVAELDEEPR